MPKCSPVSGRFPFFSSRPLQSRADGSPDHVRAGLARRGNLPPLPVPSSTSQTPSRPSQPPRRPTAAAAVEWYLGSTRSTVTSIDLTLLSPLPNAADTRASSAREARWKSWGASPSVTGTATRRGPGPRTSPVASSTASRLRLRGAAFCPSPKQNEFEACPRRGFPTQTS